MYSDGYASVLDLGDWVGVKRVSRVTTNGMPPEINNIVGEINFAKPYIMLLSGSTRNNIRRFCFVENNFKHKNRTARTKLINLKPDEFIDQVISVSFTDMLNLVTSPMEYLGRLRTVADSDRFNSEYFQGLLS
ncbi:hypothetical protein D3C71_1843890 [compost metagenome]